MWRGQLDLPDRMGREVPRWMAELIVAFAGIGLAVGVRVGVDMAAPNIVPFALSFPVIAAATLLAGPRAGLMTLVGCQLLTWYAILPPQRSFEITSLTTFLNLLLSTVAQLVMLAAVAAYRKVAVSSHNRDREQIDGLSLALEEIDHRTKNNFQIAISLLTIQARATSDPALKAGLSRAATRLQAIASVYKNLALSSADLQEIRLHAHLEEICARLCEGLLPPAVSLELECQPVIVGHELAIRIGLIVNELVTNAAKHAFPEGTGNIRVQLSTIHGRIELIVSDDGRGLGHQAVRDSDGLGTRLVAMLTQQIGASMEVVGEEGTLHRLRIPLNRMARESSVAA